MTPEERAAELMRSERIPAGDLPAGWADDLQAKIAHAIRAAVAEEQERLLKTGQARFHANAAMPTTWEHQVIEDAKDAGAAAEREACAKIAEHETKTADPLIRMPGQWKAKKITDAIRNRSGEGTTMIRESPRAGFGLAPDE